MKHFSKAMGLMVLTGAAVLFPGSWEGASMPAAYAAAGSSPIWTADDSYRKDLEAATFEEQLAYKIYRGKLISEVEADFTKDAKWTRLKHKSAALHYKRNAGKDYYEKLYVYAQPDHPELVGDFRICFYTKKLDMAENIFMAAQKNFSYNLGRPSIKKGGNSNTWFLDKSSRILVEFSEYDPRLPIATEYPFEIAIYRQYGDYSAFFMPPK